MRELHALLIGSLILAGAASAVGQGWQASDTVANPMNQAYTQALVRLKVDIPESVGRAKVGVRVDGRPVPHQIDEGGRLWVAVTVEPLGAVTFEVSDQPTETQPIGPFDPMLIEELSADLTAEAREQLDQAGPLFARWTTSRGTHGRTTVTIPRGKPYAVIRDTGPMQWAGPLGVGFKPTAGLMRRWHSGPFQGSDKLEEVALSNDATRVPGAIINLQPRWTQGYDEAWFFGATDGQRMVGLLPLRAGQWRWPHDALLKVRVDEQGELRVDRGMERGRRYFLFLAGPRELAGRVHDIAKIEGFAPLDKLHNEYVFGPIKQGDKPAGIADFYSNNTNPTGMLRRQGRNALKDALAGKTRGGLGAAYECQARFDADWYGLYEHGWSPINPNFYTDFIKLPIAQAAMLRNEPCGQRVRQLAEDALRRDMAYAVTLPGGAGQECPGYQAHAAQQWQAMQPLAKKYLGFDPAQWPQWQATGQFILHSSQPVGDGKRAFHPGGDTHPGRPDPAAFAAEFGYSADVKKFTTEELPGFGVIFRHEPGTVNETYLAFKAGPNRGHYHGDQLSFHLCFDARPAAVDHHASYKPRPGQEHMHNRLSFATDDFPFANMDGHERLIAFKTSDAVDVAVAQVESPRIRKVKELPPEDWDDDVNQQRFDTPLTYRRTIVFVKQATQADGKLPLRPFFVIRDQYVGPELSVTHNLHALGTDAKVDGQRIQFDKLNAVVVKPGAIKPELFKWEHTNGGLEQTVNPRITVRGGEAEFITVLFPGDHTPTVEPTDAGVKVGDTHIYFGPGLPHKDHPQGQASFGVTVRRGNDEMLSVHAGDIDLDRSQGDIGLFVPDVGYPFGPIPDWLIEQRGQAITTE